VGAMEKAVGQSAIPCVNMIPEYRTHFGEKRLHPEERSALSQVPELGTLGSVRGRSVMSVPTAIFRISIRRWSGSHLMRTAFRRSIAPSNPALGRHGVTAPISDAQVRILSPQPASPSLRRTEADCALNQINRMEG
jgi:hypothetical protein